MIEDSGIQGTPLEWESDKGPRCSRRLREQALMGDLLSTNYALMSQVEADREPTHVGEALRHNVCGNRLWRGRFCPLNRVVHGILFKDQQREILLR